VFKGNAVRLRTLTLLCVVLAIALGAAPAALGAQSNREAAPSDPPPTEATPATAPGGETSNPYYHLEVITLDDGRQLGRSAINGPSEPPPGYERERAPVATSALNRPGAAVTLSVPAYNWVFGCSSVSASMIGAYFDRNGLPNIYTGPTNGGVMPDNNGVWPTWTDSVGKDYPGNPLAASRMGSDGRTIRGSIDDYWVAYDSTAADPYITGGWAQHTWGDAFGDFMKTSQSSYGNRDGQTYFSWWLNGSPLTCAQMESTGSPPIATRDGGYGRKLFYEARGYSVTECYNQRTDNVVSGGFSFANYKAQIDAGYPVIINLVGHTVAGIGYDTSTSPATIYINDTWDYQTHSMFWGQSYSGMALDSVSVVNPALPSIPTPTISGLNPSSATPGGQGFTLTVNGTNFINGSVVRWNGSDRTTTYVNSTQLTAAITAADIASASTASVAVFSPGSGGGRTSNAVSFTVGTMRKTYLPVTLKTPPAPSGPTPGYWQHPQGAMEFYVTSDRASVDDFAMWVDVKDCGKYKITHLVAEPISGTSFAWSGPFYASGTFSSQTTASGSLGLDDLYIDGCGTVRGGPWSWTASWQHSAQAAPAGAVETDGVAPASSNSGFKATRIR
jgi:IPT/TIG domain